MPALNKNHYFVSCDEIWSGRTGTTFTIEGNREYLRRFLVVVRFKEMGPYSVCLAPGLPRARSLYVTNTDYDLLALAVKFEAKQADEDDWQRWIVEVTYSTKLPPAGSKDNTQNNPENEPADIEWDYEVGHEAPFSDLDGLPFLNTAQQPFSPPPTFPVAYPILNISRNELTYDAYKGAYYSFALNDDSFLGFPPGTVQCLPPKAKQVSRGSLVYWRVTYKLKFSYIVDNPSDDDYAVSSQGLPIGLRSFQPKILNKGSEHMVAGHPEAILDKRTGRTVRLLDESGEILEPSVPGAPLVPYFVPFRMYRSASFNSLLVDGLS